MCSTDLWIGHVAISVSNMEETIQWYHEMLGLELTSKEYILPCSATVATMAMGTIVLEIFKHDEPIPLPECRKNPDLDAQTQGVKHFCLNTDHLELLIAALRAKGVEVIKGPVHIADSTLYYICDNSGNPIEIMQKG